MKRFAFFLLSVTIIYNSGCTDAASTDSTKDASTPEKEPATKLTAGKEKFYAYCYSCHNDEGEGAARLAPSIQGMQQSYKGHFKSEEDFNAGLISFVSNPSKEKAVMKAAVEKFGLMPPMAYPTDELEQIAYYIYHGSFETNKAHSSPDNDPKTLGQQIAMSTKSLLGKNLMAALNSGGPVHALSFCNTKAIHYTDSMSQAMNADIKRVSDKPRNPNNIAMDTELEAIEYFKKLIASGKQAEPITVPEGGGHRFYAPITTNAMCLQCHGQTGKDISPETTQKIEELYPADKATGYGLNEVRGIWSIYFNPS